MNIRSHLKCIMLTCATLMSVGSLFSAAVNPTGYYSSANLTRLNDLGIRKHAPLTIFIDEENDENPQSDNVALTISFAHMLKEAFAPLLVSRSIAYNYFYRRFEDTDDVWQSVYATIPLDEWTLYEVPHSQFILFVPDHYIKYYKSDLGLKLNNLKNITTDADDYLELLSNVQPSSVDNTFSIDNLRTVLNTISFSSSEQLTKSELKQQAKSPIWDIILHGHGQIESPRRIGGISADNMQKLLNFFNNELPVGTFFIETCSVGGENLSLLEFDKSVNKEKILRNLDYILIVGSITDAPTYVSDEKDDKKSVKFYNNAAQLQGRGTSLDRLLNDLTPLQRSTISPHGTNDIPQIWLPGGLGFQTYQIDQRIQVLNNVKVRKHEDEKSPIILDNRSIAALIYVDSIDVPIVVTPRATLIMNQEDWINIPSFAELYQFVSDSINYLDPVEYPALTKLYNSMENKAESANRQARRLLYPQFIAMARNQNSRHFKKIKLESPTGKEKEFTGVLHFLRDAFFDIAGRTTKKIFYIDELTGNNDISLLLESIRLDNESPNPSSLELELRSSISSDITLKAVTIETTYEHASLFFIFNDKLWELTFNPSEIEEDRLTFWQFKEEQYSKSYLAAYQYKINLIRQENAIDQKSISEILRSKLAEEEK